MTPLWLIVVAIVGLAMYVFGWWTRHHFGCWFDWNDNPHVSREATGQANWMETQNRIDTEIRARLKALNG